MTTDEIKKVLEDHEKRIVVLEFKQGKKGTSTARVGNHKKTLPDHIIVMRGRGFFSQPKTAEETHKKLQADYHCELNRVEVGLVRLAKRKLLRKASKETNGRKYQAHVW